MCVVFYVHQEFFSFGSCGTKGGMCFLLDISCLTATEEGSTSRRSPRMQNHSMCSLTFGEMNISQGQIPDSFMHSSSNKNLSRMCPASLNWSY